jgi:hypothetical protein
MSPEPKVGLDSFLQAGQPQFLKSPSFRRREWLIHNVGEGWPSPEPECLLALRDQSFKALRVELAVLDPNQISGSTGLQHSGT